MCQFVVRNFFFYLLRSYFSWCYGITGNAMSGSLQCQGFREAGDSMATHGISRFIFAGSQRIGGGDIDDSSKFLFFHHSPGGLGHQKCSGEVILNQ